MALINRAGREVSVKVVYYGPGLSGKTTNLELLFKQVSEDRRGKMISMKTRTDRTLFFDLLPLSADPILDFNVRILLYTVPGQVYYNATRRLVLKGVDALVFVADSEPGKLEENFESLENLRSNLTDMGLKLENLPWVIQYNKRDLPAVMSIEEMEARLNPQGVPSFEAAAAKGEGVHETLDAVSKQLEPVLRRLIKGELGDSSDGAESAASTEAPPLTDSLAARSSKADKTEKAKRLDELDAKKESLNLDDLPDPLVVEMPLSRGKTESRDEEAAPLSRFGSETEPLPKADLLTSRESPASHNRTTSRDPVATDEAGSPAESLPGAGSSPIVGAGGLGSPPADAQTPTDGGHRPGGADPAAGEADGELVLRVPRSRLESGELRLRIVLTADSESSSNSPRETVRSQ